MSQSGFENPTAEEYEATGRTKQSFKDDTDINKMLKKAQRIGSISHLQRHGAFYGDFSDIADLQTAFDRYRKGVEIFNDAPSEVRREFDNDPVAFFSYVNNPENAGKLSELLPKLAEPGDMITAPIRTADTEKVREAQVTAPETTPSGDAEQPPPAASEAPQGA